jgi:heptosyltransferase-2
VRIGHGGQFRSPLLTHVLPLPQGRGHHHSLDYEELAKAAGAETGHQEPVRLPEHFPPHIAIFAGAAYGPAKRWNRFAGVAAELSASTGLEVVFYGSSSEEAHLEGIAREAGDRACVAAGLPLPELCRRLSGAVLAIGNDSGGMHLSAFLGIPSVVLFGSTSPAWTAPSGPRVTVVCSGLDCSPCFRPVCSRGGIPPCLEAIDADRVLEAARAAIAPVVPK